MSRLTDRANQLMSFKKPAVIKILAFIDGITAAVIGPWQGH